MPKRPTSPKFRRDRDPEEEDDVIPGALASSTNNRWRRSSANDTNFNNIEMSQSPAMLGATPPFLQATVRLPPLATSALSDALVSASSGDDPAAAVAAFLRDMGPTNNSFVSSMGDGDMRSPIIASHGGGGGFGSSLPNAMPTSNIHKNVQGGAALEHSELSSPLQSSITKLASKTPKGTTPPTVMEWTAAYLNATPKLDPASQPVTSPPELMTALPPAMHATTANDTPTTLSSSAAASPPSLAASGRSPKQPHQQGPLQTNNTKSTTASHLAAPKEAFPSLASVATPVIAVTGPSVPRISFPVPSVLPPQAQAPRPSSVPDMFPVYPNPAEGPLGMRPHHMMENVRTRSPARRITAGNASRHLNPARYRDKTPMANNDNNTTAINNNGHARVPSTLDDYMLRYGVASTDVSGGPFKKSQLSNNNGALPNDAKLMMMPHTPLGTKLPTDDPGSPTSHGRGLMRRHSNDDLMKMTDPHNWRAASPSPANRGGGTYSPGLQSPGVGSNHSSASKGFTTGGGKHSSGDGSGHNDFHKKRTADRQRMAKQVDEDDVLERQKRNAVVSSALHSIPWLQRKVDTASAFGSDECAMFSAPRFWARMDWTFRATFFAVLPATILSLDPNSTTYFALPSTVSSFAYWITMPTLGGGLREFVIVFKGTLVCTAFLMIILVINPTVPWLFVILYFLQILLIALVAESIKKTAAWMISVFMLQLYSTPELTDYAFARDFLISVLIGGGMGILAFVIPKANWSLKIAQRHCSTCGSALSIVTHGVVNSFWSESEMEREFCLIRIRQLMQVAAQCQEEISARLGEAEYEPHSGRTLANTQRRVEFLQDVTRIVACLLQLAENVNAKPEVLKSALLSSFSVRLADPLAILVSAMDNTILKISDCKHPIAASDIQLFCSIREDFQEELSEIRETLILNNDQYTTEEADIFLGGFLFCIDELGEIIAHFSEPEKIPNRLLDWAISPYNDFWAGYDAVVFMTRMALKGTLVRRAKEAIKLALSMTIPLLIQVFLLSPEDATPVAGPAVIAFVYQRTGAESFQYAMNRVLGTVIGSLTALIAVQIAGGELWQLYIYLAILSLFGNFVQTSPPYMAAGNALVFSVISIISQYNDKDAAMGRIQQNVFAILIYFAIAYVVWPVRAIEKLQLELDSAIRSYRETIYKLLGTMDAPLEEVDEVIQAAEDLWKENVRRVQREGSLIPAAVREPTMIGAPFPEQAWLKLVASQQTLAHLAWMMRFAFQAFERSTSGMTGDRSLHWFVIQKIAPEARECAEVIYSACDLYLLALSHSELVPIQHLVRLRASMMVLYRKIVHTYTAALTLRLEHDDGGKHREEHDSFSAPPTNEISKHSGDKKIAPTSSSKPHNNKPPATTHTTNAAAAAAAPTVSSPTVSKESSAPVGSFTVSEEALHKLQTTMGPSDTFSFPMSKPPITHEIKRPAPLQKPSNADNNGVASPVLSGTILEEVGIDFTRAAGSDEANGSEMEESSNFVLRNRDIHSLEAFIFGIRASVMEIGEFQKALLQVQHAAELVKTL